MFAATLLLSTSSKCCNSDILADIDKILPWNIKSRRTVVFDDDQRGLKHKSKTKTTEQNIRRVKENLRLISDAIKRNISFYKVRQFYKSKPLLSQRDFKAPFIRLSEERKQNRWWSHLHHQYAAVLSLISSVFKQWHPNGNFSNRKWLKHFVFTKTDLDPSSLFHLMLPG